MVKSKIRFTESRNKTDKSSFFLAVHLIISSIQKFQGLLNHSTNIREARRTTILQPVEKKTHSQKDRQDERAEGYVPDEGTR